MNLEKRLKARIDQKLNGLAKNPYGSHKRFPLWAKIVIPSGSAIIALGIVGLILLSQFGAFIHYPSLRLNEYKVNLNDAESIGIIPNKNNVSDVSLVKKVEGTGEIKPISFISKKNSNKQKAISNNRVLARINEDTYDSFVKEQDDLGWIVSKYFVYKGQYVFVEFVPKHDSFEHFETVEGYGEISDILIQKAYNEYQAVRDQKEGVTTIREGAYYHVQDYDINHYINNSFLISDTMFMNDITHKSYIIEPESGYIYSLETIGLGIYFDYQKNNLVIPEYREHYFGTDIELSINDEKLIVKEVPSANYKDRYGQYFKQGLDEDMVDQVKKIKVINEKDYGNHIVTSDNRFLFIKDGTLYEYLDNFEIIEVPDNVLYKCYGFYSDYTFISNKYIFNLAGNYIIDIKEERKAKINAIAVIDDYYFYLDSHNKLRYEYDPYSVLKTTGSLDDVVLGYEFNDSPYDPEKVGFNVPSNLDNYDSSYNHELLETTANYLTDNVTSYELNWMSAIIQNPIHIGDGGQRRGFAYSDANSIVASSTPIGSELTISKLTVEGDTKYVVTIKDGQIKLVEIDDYSKEPKEYVLTPINI